MPSGRFLSQGPDLRVRKIHTMPLRGLRYNQEHLKTLAPGTQYGNQHINIRYIQHISNETTTAAKYVILHALCVDMWKPAYVWYVARAYIYLSSPIAYMFLKTHFLDIKRHFYVHTHLLYLLVALTVCASQFKYISYSKRTQRSSRTQLHKNVFINYGK